MISVKLKLNVKAVQLHNAHGIRKYANKDQSFKLINQYIEINLFICLSALTRLLYHLVIALDNVSMYPGSYIQLIIIPKCTLK